MTLNLNIINVVKSNPATVHSMAESEPDRQSQGEAPLPLPQTVMNSDELFRGERELCIRHDGELYRLRITRRGRLILQK